MYVLVVSVWWHLGRIQWIFQHCAELRPQWPGLGGVMMAPASAPSALTASVCLKPLGPVTDTNKVPITGGSSSGWVRSKVTRTETNKVTMKVSCFARYGSSVTGLFTPKGSFRLQATDHPGLSLSHGGHRETCRSLFRARFWIVYSVER